MIRRTSAAPLLGLFLAGLLSISPSAALRSAPSDMLADLVFTPSTPEPDGPRFRFVLPAHRAPWTSHAWSLAKLPRPFPTDSDALRFVVESSRPRADIGVFLALGESDGSWYLAPWAADLTQPKNTGLARLRDFQPCEWTSPGTPGGKFFDENSRLDPDQVTSVAFGVVSGQGVGEVEFKVLSLDWARAGTAAGPSPVSVTVDGRYLSTNGTDFLPAGLFGGYNLKELDAPEGKVRRNARYRLAFDRVIGRLSPTAPEAGPSRVIQVTGGDRGLASPRLANPKWREEAEAEGARIGAAAAASGQTAYVEYYNEPYLNWANKNRRSFNPVHFDQSKAEEDGPVAIKHDGTVLPHLRWTQNFDAPLWQWTTRENWRRGRDASGRVYSEFAEPTPWSRKNSAWAPETHPPLSVADGETYVVKTGKKGQEKEVTLTAFTPWYVYDETQFTYWSARGLGRLYDEPMAAFGQAFKASGGEHAVYIVGWGFRPSEDDWAGFDYVYKPTIDAGIAFIDGVNNHDYGGDPLKMAANYEVVCAYGVTAHNKWLFGYNTECSPSQDPQAYAAAGEGGSAALASARWVAAKILHSLDYVPDKARSFLWFGGPAFFQDDGEGMALDALLALRGRLVSIRSDQLDVFVSAAVDGTDPLAPRPASLGPGPELVVAAYNSAGAPRPLHLSIAAPQGSTLGAPLVRALRESQGRPVIVDLDRLPETIGAQELLVLRYPLAGEISSARVVRRSQSFAPVILREVRPEAPLQTDLPIPVGTGAPERAWLQLVLERAGEGEGAIEINGHTLALPAAITPPNTSWMRRVPINPAWLRDSNTVRLSAATAAAGYRVASLGLVVERDGPPAPPTQTDNAR